MERGRSQFISSHLLYHHESCLFVLPLAEFWVEVSLLGDSPPLGGGLLVRQQDEGNIRVCTVLGAGLQGSVGIQRSHSQHVLVLSAPGQKCDDKEVTCHINQSIYRDLQE